jgi:hypothetical protein
MSEENTGTETNNEPTENLEGEQTQQVENKGPSEAEQKALEMGWRPKEEFEGDPDDFIDATEFVRRKPLFEKIDVVGRELRETKKALRALQAHHEKVKEAEYKHALDALRAEKRAALESGDADALIKIDDQIADAKAAEAVLKAQQTQVTTAPHPGFVKWVDRNKWYGTDAELRTFADQVGTSYAAANPDKDPDTILDYVEKRVRKLYPEKFSNPNKTRPSSVEGSQTTPSRTNESDILNYPLTDDERRVMMTFVRQGILSKEDYIKQLKVIKNET